MAKRSINVSLSQHGIESVLAFLQEYQAELQAKCEQFVSELADIGIETAKWNLFNLINDTDGNMISVGDKVTFRKELQTTIDGANCIIIPASQPFESVWATGSAIVDPLLMAEFGSGMFAVDGHRGTFPNQKHAFDPNGWYWRDLQGKLHHSRGIEPVRPLTKAVDEMRNQIQAITEKVFIA